MSVNKEDLAAYKDALRALDELAAEERAAGIDYETPEYLRRNAAVIAAEQKIPRWRRTR